MNISFRWLRLSFEDGGMTEPQLQVQVDDSVWETIPTVIKDYKGYNPNTDND